MSNLNYGVVDIELKLGDNYRKIFNANLSRYSDNDIDVYTIRKKDHFLVVSFIEDDVIVVNENSKIDLLKNKDVMINIYFKQEV